MKRRVTVSYLMMFFSTGCATLFSGTKQLVAVHSEPPGARVYVNKEYKGDTPVSFQVKRKLESYNIELKKPGHPIYQSTLEHQFNPISIVNLAFAPGWLIDALSGALMKYEKNVHYTLESPIHAPVSVVGSNNNTVAF